jgi:hypothetical protein
MFEDWQYWPVIRPIIALFSSRKFLVALAPLLLAVGFDLSPEWITVIASLGA